MPPLDNSAVRRFIQDRVTLPASREKKFNAQVQHLRNQFQSYAAAHPNLTVKKLHKLGSLGKRTHTSKLNDIDLAAHVDLGRVNRRTVERVNGPRLITQVRDVIRQVYGATKNPSDIQAGNSAVKVNFRGSGLDVDIVPVIIDPSSTADEGWVIKGHSQKVYTCIPRHQAFIQRIQQAHPGYIELVRLLKWWRDVHKDQRPNFQVRSFLLELTAAHLCRTRHIDPSRPLDAFRAYLNWLHVVKLRHPIAFTDWHAAPSRRAGFPAVYDPANPANNVAEKLVRNPSYYRELIEVARISHEQLQRVSTAPSLAQARDAAAWVLGPEIKSFLS